MKDSPRNNILSSGAHLRVLLAEDNPVNQRLGTVMLESLGHTVTVAGNGQEVCSLTEQQIFDVVLMDIEMPVMNGEEATHAIRERERLTGARIPIIALSAHDAADGERFLMQDMDGFLPKPFKLEDLAQALADVRAR